MENRPKVKATRFNKFLSTKHDVDRLYPNREIQVIESTSSVRGLKRNLSQNQRQNDDFVSKRQCFTSTQSDKFSCINKTTTKNLKKNMAESRMKRIREKIKAELATKANSGVCTNNPNSSRDNEKSTLPLFMKEVERHSATKNRFNFSSNSGVPSSKENQEIALKSTGSQVLNPASMFLNVSKGSQSGISTRKLESASMFSDVAKNSPSRISKNLADERLKRVRKSLENKDIYQHKVNVKKATTSSVEYGSVNNSSHTYLDMTCNKNNTSPSETKIEVNISVSSTTASPPRNVSSVPERTELRRERYRKMDYSNRKCKSQEDLNKPGNRGIKRSISAISDDYPKNIVSKKMAIMNMDHMLSDVKPSASPSKRLSAIREKQKTELDLKKNSPRSKSNSRTSLNSNNNDSIICDKPSVRINSSVRKQEKLEKSIEKHVSRYNVPSETPYKHKSPTIQNRLRIVDRSFVKSDSNLITNPGNDSIKIKPRNINNDSFRKSDSELFTKPENTERSKTRFISRESFRNSDSNLLERPGSLLRNDSQTTASNNSLKGSDSSVLTNSKGSRQHGSQIMNDPYRKIESNMFKKSEDSLQSESRSRKESFSFVKSSLKLNQSDDSILHGGSTSLLVKTVNDSFDKVDKWFSGQESVSNDFNVSAKSDDSLLVNCNDTVCSNLVNDVEEMEWTSVECDSALTGKDEILAQPPTNEEEPKAVKSTKSRDVCVVTDTNIFISHIDTVKNIMKLKGSASSKAFIYIPWMVLSELDNLKDNTHCPKLKRGIMESVRLINGSLNVENSKVIGQSVEKAALQKHISKSPDDKIVACCMQAMEEYETVVLLSNDVNLRNKAMVNDIPVCTSKDALIVIMNKLTKNVKYQKVCRKFEMLFSSVICECAKEAYGDAWTRMDMLKCPPWGLRECLKRFKKYWAAVFKDKLLKHFTKAVDDLLKLLEEHMTICDDSPEYNDFMKLGLDLCLHLKDIEESRPYVQKVIDEIIKIA